MKHTRSSSSLTEDCPAADNSHRDGDKLPQEGTSPLLSRQDRAAIAAACGSASRRLLWHREIY